MNDTQFANAHRSANPIAPPADSYEAMVKDIYGLLAPLNDILLRKTAVYAPRVHHIIRTRSRKVQEIEHTLDHLLDCACIPEGLALFKSLCRYYCPINPAATASYVHGYREMWDSDEAETELQPALSHAP